MCTKTKRAKLDTSFTFELSTDMKDRIFEMAESQQRTASSLVRHLIAVEIKRQEELQQAVTTK